MLHEEVFIYKFWAVAQIAVVKSGRKYKKKKKEKKNIYVVGVRRDGGGFNNKRQYQRSKN